jgi:hypothetical protein
MINKILKVLSIVLAILGSVLLLYGSIKIARVTTGEIPQDVSSGIPGIEIAYPERIIGIEDARLITVIALGLLIFSIVVYLVVSSKVSDDTE